jgi:hypothetical protein
MWRAVTVSFPGVGASLRWLRSVTVRGVSVVVKQGNGAARRVAAGTAPTASVTTLRTIL